MPGRLVGTAAARRDSGYAFGFGATRNPCRPIAGPERAGSPAQQPWRRCCAERPRTQRRRCIADHLHADERCRHDRGQCRAGGHAPAPAPTTNSTLGPGMAMTIRQVRVNPRNWPADIIGPPYPPGPVVPTMAARPNCGLAAGPPGDNRSALTDVICVSWLVEPPSTRDPDDCIRTHRPAPDRGRQSQLRRGTGRRLRLQPEPRPHPYGHHHPARLGQLAQRGAPSSTGGIVLPGVPDQFARGQARPEPGRGRQCLPGDRFHQHLERDLHALRLPRGLGRERAARSPRSAWPPRRRRPRRGNW